MVNSPPGLTLEVAKDSGVSSEHSGAVTQPEDELSTLAWNISAPSFVPLPSPDDTIQRLPPTPLVDIHPDRLNELHHAAQHLAADLHNASEVFNAGYMDDQFVMHEGQPVAGMSRVNAGPAAVVGGSGVQVPQQAPRGLGAADDALLADLPPFTIVTSMNEAVDISRYIEKLGPNLIALDCEGVNLSATGKLTLVQIAVSTGPDSIHCYLFDAEALGRIEVLRGILENPSLVKVIHDVYRDSAALYHQHQICLAGILDTQLVYEYMNYEMLASMSTVVRWLGEVSPSKDDGRDLMRKDPEIWSRRPIQNALIKYAVNDVAIILKVARMLVSRIGSNMPMLMHASAQRCRSAIDSDLRCIAFSGNRLTSRELRGYRDTIDISPVQIDDDMESIYVNLPPSYRSKLLKSTGAIQFIMLDLGAPPRATYHHDVSLGGRGNIMLDDVGHVVTKKVLKLVEASLEDFGADGRCVSAGVDGTLHRISCIRSVSGELSGITFKVGRAVLNNCNLFPDILFSTKNILVIGLPNSGKTTMLREMGRKLSEQAHVVCVDTINELFGDGEKVHRGAGYARRMQVPANRTQAEIISAAIRNHSPEVLICDFVSDPKDIEALFHTKSRGIRLIVSASGTLHELMDNSMMHPLLGLDPTKKWGRRARSHAPLFDAIVECNVECFNRVRIYSDAARSIDSIMQTGASRSEIRHRNNSGEVSLDLKSS